MKVPDPKVLILDDSPSLTTSLKELLSRQGLEILTATTAQDALSLAGDNEVGAICLDVRLGGDPDGFQCARRFHELNPQTRIFFYTAFDSSEAHEQARNLGLDNCVFLSKAERSIDDLRLVLREALDGYTSDRASDQTPNDPEKPLVRLDTIDLALYRALHSHPELLQTMEWRKFEKLVADVLETLEYEVELQKGTKDGGIDIIAVKRSAEWGDHRYLLQAKRWKDRVGVEPVQRLLFLKSDLGATKCCLATTSTFTRGAWALHRDYRWELELRDFNGLREWIAKALRQKEAS